MNDRIEWQGIDLLLRLCAYIHNKYDIPFSFAYKIFENHLCFLEYFIQLDDERTWEDDYILVCTENENEDVYEFINEWVSYLNEKGLNPYRKNN